MRMRAQSFMHDLGDTCRAMSGWCKGQMASSLQIGVTLDRLKPFLLKCGSQACNRKLDANFLY